MPLRDTITRWWTEHGWSRHVRTRDIHKQREGNMNTIQITTVDGVVNYTESEVTRFIGRAGEADAIQQVNEEQRKEIRDNRNKVRDFFSEGQWDDGEFTASKRDINELLESIGANKLTTKYRASFTITGTFNIEVEDEDDVESIFADNVNVDFYDGDIDVDQIEVLDIEEDN
jgi:hypothetical protein